ncbi:39S ribosomal protein L41, mitochondrial [Octopus sinensis]|uniref:39S ribosomal protein L41, mitochondrial n=1 Tax=Octopus sinensis TaxID=2607531 RepID=A0A6P7SGJ3_9MOLL|nr:39S ribosomal protein L41, mitochondrial [Octopus sinensis]
MQGSTLQIVRSLRTSSFSLGKKTRDPFDQRFEVTGKHAKRDKPHHKQVQSILAKHIVPEVGGFSRKTGKYCIIPEMIPNIVVPDLTDCELKPYVSYKVPDVVQSQFTAKELFDACYAPSIIEEHNASKR